MLDVQTIDALDALDNVDDGYQHDITKILPTDYVVTEIADYQNNSSDLIDVYIDIETIPGAFMPDISDLKVPSNYKKPETIQKWIEERRFKLAAFFE